MQPISLPGSAPFDLPDGARVLTDEPLAPRTTLRCGGPAGALVESDPATCAEALLAADRSGTPAFVLGGGSNVLVSDTGFAGVVVHPIGGAKGAPDISEAEASDGTVLVRAGSGVAWDELVGYTVGRGLGGLEALSGIPGDIGSAVMQNLGAYGQEIGTRLAYADMLDRETGAIRTYAASELGLGYRTSMLRASLEEPDPRWKPSPRWFVLDAAFALASSFQGTVGHAQLASALGCSMGDRMPLEDLRAAVLEVRARKGMLADPDPTGPQPLHDRWSSGSFFTNPVLDENTARTLLPEDAPRYHTAAPGYVKTSAAWLIERAGFPKGYGVHGPSSRATLSNLHTLALTNRGAAGADDVIELARTVRDGVRDRFGVALVPETVLVGIEL